MKLSKVTVTGADSSVRFDDMLRIAEKYPFVEWGILVSKKGTQFIRSRFPSKEWIARLQRYSPSLKLSCHLCGSWLDDLCVGSWDPYLVEILPMFDRVQLNFHGADHDVSEDAFTEALKSQSGKQFIFQLDNVNNDLLHGPKAAGVDVAGLFDLSHGAGVLPDAWPEPVDVPFGYAGGLSPENVKGQLVKMEEACGDRTIWIDAETLLRSDDDIKLEIPKVEAYLAAAQPYVAD